MASFRRVIGKPFARRSFDQPTSVAWLVGNGSGPADSLSRPRGVARLDLPPRHGFPLGSCCDQVDGAKCRSDRCGVRSSTSASGLSGARCRIRFDDIWWNIFSSGACLAPRPRTSACVDGLQIPGRKIRVWRLNANRKPGVDPEANHGFFCCPISKQGSGKLQNRLNITKTGY